MSGEHIDSISDRVREAEIWTAQCLVGEQTACHAGEEIGIILGGGASWAKARTCLGECQVAGLVAAYHCAVPAPK